MSTPTLAVAIGLGYASALILFLTLAILLCKSAAMGDDIARRALGPASSSPDFEHGLILAMDDDPTPHGRRHA